MTSPLLDAHSITKRFAGITALDHVSLDVSAGELVVAHRTERRRQDHVLQLPVRASSTPTAARSPSTAATSPGLPVHRRARLGLARTFQRIELFAGMTVREHLLVAARAHRRRGGL